MNLQIIDATPDDHAIIQNLARFYVYDFTEYTGWACPETGLFGGCDELLNDLLAGHNYACLFRVDGELAGFAGVAQDPEDATHYISEFFVLRKFRGCGFGHSAACMLFDRFPGLWKVQQLAVNIPAVVFWRKIIAAYTDGHYVEESPTESPWGIMYTQRFSVAE